MLQGHARQTLEVDRENAEFVQRMVFQRIRRHLRLAQIGLLEAVTVDDQNSVGLEVGNVHFERGGIHDHQDVNSVAGCIDIL